MSAKIYEMITDRIISLLEAGTIPWRKPWTAREQAPLNFVSGKAYRGINAFLLACAGFSSPYWMTFKQAGEGGGKVRKGERGFPVIFWKLQETEDKETGEIVEVPLLRYYTVFNISQVEGIEAPEQPETPTNDFDPISEAVAIVDAMPQRPDICHGYDKAFYRPSVDMIGMPDPERFSSPAEYYSTLFHEMTHSTGHGSRLARKGLDDWAPFGSASYAKEELVAEMGGAYLCAHSGIEAAVIENQAAYIKGWLGKLRQDNKLVIHAAAQAQKAADFILARSAGQE